MTTPDALADAEYITDILHVPNDDSFDHDGVAHEREPEEGGGGGSSSRRRGIQARTKSAFLDRLLRDLDILVYCELSGLYYMDCSILHFAIRAIIQVLFLTPKAGPFPETPKNQPYMGAILITNLICMLLHFMSSNPTAGEGTRGYLHGGLFIDFVGQKGPISRTQLLIADLLIFILQVIMFSVNLECEKTKLLLASNSTDSTTTAPDRERTQDHDLEERGMLRSQSPTPLEMAENDIELQTIPLRDTNNDNADNDNERRSLLSSTVDGDELQHHEEAHPRDHFASGEALIMNINVRHIFQQQWRDHTTASAIQPSSSALPDGREAASLFFRRRFGLQTGTNS